MEWYWMVGIVWTVCIGLNIFIQFCTNIKDQQKYGQDTNCTFESLYLGPDSTWGVFIFGWILFAPLAIIICMNDYKELELRKDINYNAVIYLLPVLCLLGLYWV